MNAIFTKLPAKPPVDKNVFIKVKILVDDKPLEFICAGHVDRHGKFYETYSDTYIPNDEIVGWQYIPQGLLP